MRPTEERTYREYPGSVEIVESDTDLGPRYRFDAPMHEGREFEIPEMAELYADVYFDVDSFREEKSGERGVPPAVAVAGKDTLAAYLITQSGMSVTWASRFMGVSEGTVRTYLSRVRQRAEERREELVEAPAEAAEDVLEGRGLPGSSENLEQRKSTLLELHDHLRTNRSATTDDLKAMIDPERVGYQSVKGFWRNIVGDGHLSALPGVESPGGGGTTWRYVESEQ